MIQQMDYICLIYGLSFFIMGITCLRLVWHPERPPLPWTWLYLFGILHGVNEWMDMVALGLSYSTAFNWARMVLLTLSFIALFEFGRRGWKMQGRKASWAWFLLPVLIVAGTAGKAGLQGMNPVCRYALGLPGGLLSAWVLWRTSSMNLLQWRGLRLAAVAMLFYALATGLVVPQAALWPATWLNHDTFFNLTGFPIQLVRTVCAFICMAGLTMVFSALPAVASRKYLFKQGTFPFTLILIIAISWFTAEYYGRTMDTKTRQDILRHAVNIANSINPRQVKALSFTIDDVDRPEFVHLKRQLIAYKQFSNLHGICTEAIRNNQIVFGPETYLPSDPLATPPGTVYEKPQPEDWQVLRMGIPQVYGPFTDEFGTFISAMAPVKDNHSGTILMSISVDMPATLWKHAIVVARLKVILLFLFPIIILIVGKTLLSWRQIFNDKEKPWHLQRIEPIIAAVLGCAITLIFTVIIRDRETFLARHEFNRVAESQRQRVNDEFTALYKNLMYLTDFFQNSENVTPKEFAKFTPSLLENTSIQTLEWAAIVPAAGKERFESEMRAQGLDRFLIATNEEGQGASAGTQEYYPIVYALPFPTSGRAIGSDLGADPVWNAAIQKAIHTPRPVDTATTLLTEKTDLHKNLVLLMPVIKEPDTPPAGMILCTLDPQNILNMLMLKSQGPTKDLLINMDIWNMGGKEPSLLASFPPHKTLPHMTPLHHPSDPHDRMAFPLFMFDQPWIITTSATAPSTSALPQALALLAGLFSTIVMTLLVWYFSQRRMHLEDELSKSETRYHQLFETIHDGFALHEIICDKEGHAINYRFLQVNAGFEALTGLTARQLIDHTVLDIMPDTEQYWIDIYGKVALTGQPTHFQNYSRVLKRWFEVTAYCPAIGQFTTVFHDITEQKKTDDVKAQNARANQRLLDGLPYPAMLVHKDHIIITANRAAIAAGAKAGNSCWQGFLSKTAAADAARHQAGHHGNAQNSPCVYCMAEEALETQTPACKPGVAVGNRMYEIHWVPLDMDMYLHFVVDVTERLIAENQIRESEKMRSIALLASGVAHEINNPISGIMGYAELTLDAVGAEHPVAEFAREIIRETQRVADIVKNLLRFARQEEGDQSTASVRDMIEGTLTLIQTLLRHSRVILEVNLPETLPPVRCRVQQIQQVLMNLLTNARDALNEKYPEHHPDKKILITASTLKENADTWVRITIEDHGAGIPLEIQPRIFETFFTTKPRDKGTGLGLSISTDIIKGHHGRITFDSKPGQYARFYVDLPAEASDAKSL